jgi:CRISPR system Cascade subunit CasE
MYLSRLELDLASRDVRRDLAESYEMHRTILRAFPDGVPGRVLFRVDRHCSHRPTVLVQSELEPDWDRVGQEKDYFQVPPEYKIVAMKVRREQKLRFRLRANVTVKRDGKRHGLYSTEDQCAWLVTRGKDAGFSIPARPQDGGGEVLAVVATKAGRQTTRRRSGDRSAQVHFGVDFEGHMCVTDSDSLIRAIESGIGPGKAFGFGLLSVAPG